MPRTGTVQDSECAVHTPPTIGGRIERAALSPPPVIGPATSPPPNTAAPITSRAPPLPFPAPVAPLIPKAMMAMDHVMVGSLQTVNHSLHPLLPVRYTIVDRM